MQLLLGCGNSREKKTGIVNRSRWSDLVTVDISPECGPDVVWDLNDVPLPFAPDSASEIHAYEVLEHTGAQGDYKFFFRQFEDFWRILEPNGYLFASVPNFRSVWAWGDPGHTRTINLGSLAFLIQRQYVNQIGVTPMTDYRSIYKGNFELVAHEEDDNQFRFILQAIK